MESKIIKNFYDDFSAAQQKTGITDRISILNSRLLGNGLNKYSRVLELGCGIGILSAIIARTVKKGYLESVDLSPKSIEITKARQNKNRNFKAIAADIVTYKSQSSKFDFITLFDVIEHIPIELHENLFQNISSFVEDQTKLLLNIPSPYYINYLRKTKPELLQIVDQEIHLNLLVNILTKNNLQIKYFESYSIWEKDDYQFFVIEKTKEVTKEGLAINIGLFAKIKRKLNRILLKSKI